MKKSLIIIMLALAQVTLHSQQDLMVSQYMFNGLLLNPAYAGSHQYVSTTLLQRTQWVNFPGAPKTALFSIDGALPNKKMGLGLIVSNDRIGATNQTDIYANYSYQVKLGTGKLSFGIKAGVSNYMFKSNNLTVWDPNDEVFGAKRSVWIPKAGAGMYYYADKWYAGFSIPSLFAYDPNHTFTADVDQSTFVKRHYYLTGGYVFTLSEKLKFKPSVLLKYQPSAPLQVDLNANFLYNEQFWFGASYRTGDAVTIMVQYQTNFRLRIGYAYDLTVSKLRNYTYGTHEIMIGYDFGKKVQATPEYSKSTRYF